MKQGHHQFGRWVWVALVSFCIQVLGAGLASAHGPVFSTCGIFEVEGELRESKRHPGELEIVTDSGALSERRIALGKMDAEGLRRVSELRVAGRIKIQHACFGDCYGTWIGTDRLLAPDEEPRSFSATLMGARKVALDCQRLSAAPREAGGS